MVKNLMVDFWSQNNTINLKFLAKIKYSWVSEDIFFCQLSLSTYSKYLALKIDPIFF